MRFTLTVKERVVVLLMRAMRIGISTFGASETRATIRAAWLAAYGSEFVQ